MSGVNAVTAEHIIHSPSARLSLTVYLALLDEKLN